MTPDKYIKNYIEGKLMPAKNGQYLDTLNPATGKVYAHFPDADATDLEYAIEVASRAFNSWKHIEQEKRYRILMRLADIIEQELKVFAKAESMDSGKPYSMAMSVDVPQAFSTLRFYATSIPHYADNAFHSERHSIHYYIQRPLGVVACMSHWSFSLLSLCQLVGPALVSGNSIVAVAPNLTPMSAYLFSKACIAAGLPPGVLNIIHGDPEKLLPPLYENPVLKAWANWAEEGKVNTLIDQYCSPLKRMGFQLGAKNPAIIFADCNFHKMIVEVLRSSFSNNGQHPFSTSRIFIERTIYEKFKEELVKRTQFLKVGDSMSSVTDLGAIISKEKLEYLLGVIAMAELEGGTVLCGGKPLELSGEFEEGFFLRPAVIEGVDPNGRTNQEDFFGPIVTIAPFDTDEEAVELANNSVYGKSGMVWTQNTSRANKIASSLNVGMIWVNSWMLKEDRSSFVPLGASGNMPLGGMDLLDFFTEKKLIGQPL